MFRIRSIVLATAAVGALIAAGAGPAAAAPTASSLRQQIDEQLRLAPAGHRSARPRSPGATAPWS